MNTTRQSEEARRAAEKAEEHGKTTGQTAKPAGVNFTPTEKLRIREEARKARRF